MLKKTPPLCLAVIKPFLKKIESSEFGHRFARGAFWSLTGTVISRGLVLVASIFVARILGRTGFGELGIIQSTVGMFGVFAGFGLGWTSAKYVSEFRRSDPDRAGRIIGLSSLVAIVSGGIMALGVTIFAPWLAEHTLNAARLAESLRISAIMLFENALIGAQIGALSGFEAFKSIAFVNLFVGLASFPIMIIGAKFGGLRGSILALAANLGINLILNEVAMRKEARRFSIPRTFSRCFEEIPVLWKYSLPAVLSGALFGPANWVCSAILVNQADGYGEMGIYNAANQWYSVLLFLPGILSGVVFPILSERIGQDDTKQVVRIFAFSIKANALLVLPISLIAALASAQIVRFYGAEFKDARTTLLVVLFTAVLFSLQSPITQLLGASGRMWAGFAMNLGWASSFILATVMLVHRGSFGLALARAIGYIVYVIWGFTYAVKFLRKGFGNTAHHVEDARDAVA